jgi:hypothetical protein
MAVLLGAVNRTPFVYKGFTINRIGDRYRADAYYPRKQFVNTNLAKLKRDINNYLK